MVSLNIMRKGEPCNEATQDKEISSKWNWRRMIDSQATLEERLRQGAGFLHLEGGCCGQNSQPEHVSSPTVTWQ
jgi:hypothetical protein